MKSKKIYGKFINLRIAEEKDAEFTLAIRQNESNTEYMPKLNVNLEEQKKWLNVQRDSKDCYFFVVERLNDEPIGTFSLYNIKGNEGETGRLILRGTPIETLETCVLFHDFCFSKAKMEKVYSEIEEDNLPAFGLAKKLGAKEIGKFVEKQTGKVMKKMSATKEDYYAKRVELCKLVDRFAKRGMNQG